MNAFQKMTGWVLALVVAPLVAQGHPRERDVWHVLVAEEGQHYGSIHTQVSRLADDNYRYVIETRTLIDLLGAQRQELTERTEFVVSPDYRLKTVRSAGQQMSGRTVVAGQVKDDMLVVTSSRAGRSKTLQVDLSGHPIPRLCFEDWLADQAERVDQAEVLVLHDGAWGIGTAHVQRLAADQGKASWRVDLGVESGQGTLLLGADGILEDLLFEIPVLHMKRATAEQAKNIQYVRLNSRSVLMFPVNRDVPSMDRLEALTIRLTWREIPFEQFNLEDNRQRLVERSEQDDAQPYAVVRLFVPQSISQKLPFPVRDPQWSPYLSTTQFVVPDDPDIRATAQQIVVGKETALEAVRAISKWISEHIEVALMGETLSGPEVLHGGKGKCSEFATLFASLARSVGIPTRIVLGERLSGGHWVGHMWNEAYVGEWIAVDAAANEVGNSLALLKFIHSDSVAGTQPLRWKLTKSLNISIEDIQARPSRLAGEYHTGIAGNVYTNVDHVCRLTAPDERWKLEDKTSPGAITIRFKPPAAEDVQIHFVAFALPSVASPQMVIQGRLNLYEGSYQDFAVLKNEPHAVGSLAGQRLVFRRADETDPKRSIKTTEYVWQHGSHGYLLNLIAEAQAHDKNLKDFKRLLSSFEILDSPRSAPTSPASSDAPKE